MPATWLFLLYGLEIHLAVFAPLGMNGSVAFFVDMHRVSQRLNLLIYSSPKCDEYGLAAQSGF